MTIDEYIRYTAPQPLPIGGVCLETNRTTSPFQNFIMERAKQQAMTTPQNVIEQLIGTGSGWDQFDTMNFVVYNPSKFPAASSAAVDFEKGRVCVQYDTKKEDSEVDFREEHFAIVAKLEPCEAPKKTDIDDAPSPQELAAGLYSVYCQAVGGKAYDGKPLPTAEEFFNDPTKQTQAQAWVKVANAVLDNLCK